MFSNRVAFNWEAVAIASFFALQSAGAASIQVRPVLSLGVYWAGEYTFRSAPPSQRWQEIEKVLNSLANQQVNTIWLTHLSAEDTAEVARRAATKGISIVASIGQLAGEEPEIRHGDRRQLIERALTGWGNAPSPLAWGIGDEPRSAFMGEMAAYVRDWKEVAPRSPVTTVVMPADLDSASSVGFDMLAMDSYPFFGRGDPNGFGEQPIAAWLANVDKLVAKASTPWVMAQAFQEPWGPFKIESNGNIT